MIKGMYSKLPQSIKIGKERFIINTDFRIFIKFEMDIMEGNTKQATTEALESFAPYFFKKNQSKEELEKLIDVFLWFYHCGKQDNPNAKINNKKNIKMSQVFNYEYDSDLIWGAYWDRGFDLTQDYIHWWKFKAIWNSLTSDCEFNKIKGYRAYTGKDKEMLELKEAYKLPPTKAELEDKIRRDKLYEQLK
jgi:hypothetical protein